VVSPLWKTVHFWESIVSLLLIAQTGGGHLTLENMGAWEDFAAI